MRRSFFVRAAQFATAIVVLLARISLSTADDKFEFFERRIRPVLVEHCYECHSAASKPLKGGLRLDLQAGVQKGGDSGTIVDAGKPKQSSLIEAISFTGTFVDMPPKGKLPDRVIEDFRQWITDGAPMPADDKATQIAGPRPVDIEQGRTFWSFQPVRELPLPKVSHAQWPRRKHDWFVLQKLEEKGLTPADEADRRTLIRRLSLDLTGLPPTIEDVDAFLHDDKPNAYELLVEKYLDSPAYGERWARHWLDVARYAEDNPTSESTCKPPLYPHPYRDWVIRALNEDLPYDEFVRRQLAADLMTDLPAAEIAATGFLGLSPVYHKEPKLSKEVISVIVADEWDERLDTITRGFLGLTVTCARCHDHKFDPIRTQDYYALAGVMASTQLVEWPLVETDPAEATALTDTRLQIVDYELRHNYAEKMRATAKLEGRSPDEYERSANELKSILDKLKARELFDGPKTNAVRDAGLWVNGDDPAWTELDFKAGLSRDLPVFIRGSVTNTGELVPRRFLEVLSSGETKPFKDGSGRLELANAMLNEAQGLTARVIVNRIWGWHFGKGLVQTPSNFGQLGERPSHPELLDDLAARFVANGWSLKWLHREIVLSATYQQSSRTTPDAAARLATIDPSNRLLARMNRQRLDPETWRDSILQISGQLDHSMGGTSESLDKLENHRRSVYGVISRQKPAHVLQLFDFPDAKRHSDRRILTTTPLQQLYLLNSPFLQEQAAAFVQKRHEERSDTPEVAITEVFRAILLREPTSDEIASARELVLDSESRVTTDGLAVLAHSLLASNEFLFID